MANDMKITLSRLEEARQQYFLLKDIRAELDTAYDTYKSPDFSKQHSKKTNTVDTTFQAINKIDELERLYNRVLSKWTEYLVFVIDHIPDPGIESLIVQYYFAGKSWTDTNTHRAKKLVYEYLEKHEKELNEL